MYVYIYSSVSILVGGKMTGLYIDILCILYI